MRMWPDYVKLGLLGLSLGFNLAALWRHAWASDGPVFASLNGSSFSENRRLFGLARSGRAIADPNDAQRVRAFILKFLHGDETALRRARIGQFLLVAALIIAVVDSPDTVVSTLRRSLPLIAPIALFVGAAEWLRHRYRATANANDWL